VSSRTPRDEIGPRSDRLLILNNNGQSVLSLKLYERVDFASEPGGLICFSLTFCDPSPRSRPSSFPFGVFPKVFHFSRFGLPRPLRVYPARPLPFFFALLNLPLLRGIRLGCRFSTRLFVPLSAPPLSSDVTRWSRFPVSRVEIWCCLLFFTIQSSQRYAQDRQIVLLFFSWTASGLFLHRFVPPVLATATGARHPPRTSFLVLGRFVLARPEPPLRTSLVMQFVYMTCPAWRPDCCLPFW